MTEEMSQGVLLQTIPYLGRQKILKVFMPEEGLVTLIAKSANPSWTAFTTPFCIAEWVYKKGQKEIHTLKDGSLIDGLLELRQTYPILTQAGLMAQDLLRSQLPAKSAKNLYDLFCAYLKKLTFFSEPEILTASFRLKLLLHEGLLSLQNECCLCQAPASHLFQGESYCLKDASFLGITFTADEWNQLCLLAFGRQFSHFPQSGPVDKIENLFQERMQH
ncbi:MAG: DNA repair protein RecO [Chlamydiota bacterium]